MNTFKVKIVACSGPNFWYRDKIGNIYDVMNHHSQEGCIVIARDGKETCWVVHRGDFISIPEEDMIMLDLVAAESELSIAEQAVNDKKSQLEALKAKLENLSLIKPEDIKLGAQFYIGSFLSPL